MTERIVVMGLSIKKSSKQIKTGKRREVLRHEWGVFCQQFSQDHQEWLVDIVRHSGGSERSHEAQGLPLTALTLHLDHTHEVLSIVVRKDDIMKHIYKSIAQPHRMIVEEAEPDVRLHIDSTDGSSTIIRFYRVATPDYDVSAKSETPES